MSLNGASPDGEARTRLLRRRFEPLLLARWRNVLMIHFEVDAKPLQKAVPYELDLWDRRAFVSLVAFGMRGLRLRVGGRAGAWLLRPIANHDFLNVRTYVRHGGESGIHFLAEWLSSRLASRLGPPTFGLPYRFGGISYGHAPDAGLLTGEVIDPCLGARLGFRAAYSTRADFAPCEQGSLAQWLMERYAAFNSAGGKKRFFRVWHPPWPQREANVEMDEMSLLTRVWPWLSDSSVIGVNFSPGFAEVWMGWPHSVPAIAGSPAGALSPGFQ